MRKKGITYFTIISFFAVSILLFSGCGNKEEDSENSSKDAGEKPIVVDLEDLKENIEPEAVKQEEVTRAAAPEISFSELVDNRYTEDGKLLVDGLFQSVEVSGEGYETVGEAIRQWFLHKEESFAETIDSYEESAAEMLVEFPEFNGFYSHVNSEAVRADGSVISLKCTFSDFTGGAHGNYGSIGVTFDAKTGQELSFWDLTTDRESFSQKTLDFCVKSVEEEYADGLFPDYREVIEEVWQQEPNWYLDAAGITVIFQPYEIGPYAMGEVFVTLPYSEFEELLKPEY